MVYEDASVASVQLLKFALLSFICHKNYGCLQLFGVFISHDGDVSAESYFIFFEKQFIEQRKTRDNLSQK